MNLLYGNLRDYKLNMYNYEEEKMNKQKWGAIVIDMNIHPSLAIKKKIGEELNKRVYASVLILVFLHVFVLFMYIFWNK